MKHKIRNVVFTSLVLLISGVNVALATECKTVPENCPPGEQRTCDEETGIWGKCEIPTMPKQQ